MNPNPMNFSSLSRLVEEGRMPQKMNPLWSSFSSMSELVEEGQGPQKMNPNPMNINS